MVKPNEFDADAGGKLFRAACKKGNPFLKRSEILSFVNSRPVDRFAYLESFLDLSVADEAGQAYQEKAVRCDEKVSERQKRIEALLLPVICRLPDEVRPTVPSWHNLQEALLSRSKALRVLPDQEPWNWSAVTKAGNRAKELAEGSKLEETRATLLAGREALRRFCAESPSTKLPDITTLAVEAEELRQSSTDAPLSELLAHAQTHLQTESGAVCPVCGQAVDKERLLEEIGERLSKLGRYLDVQKRIRACAKEWRIFLSRHRELSTSIAQALQAPSLVKLDSKLAPPAGWDVVDEAKLTNEDDLLPCILAVGCREIVDWIDRWITSITEILDRKLSQLPEASQIGDLRVLARMVADANAAQEKVLKLEANLPILRRLAKVLHDVAESVRRARQDVAKKTLSAISQKVTDYYGFVHPPDEESEATGPPSIKVQRHGRGTAFVRGRFAGREVSDPKWVYSDGHLDTVGMCVFLALRRFRADRGSDPNLVVLDDVVLSVDLGHARKLIQLLRDHFGDHQLIILTHNGLFAHWCARLLPGMKRLSISSWTLEGGPRLGEYRTRMDALEQELQDGSPKDIAMDMMALMDEWLYECRYAYSLAVPAKYGEQYTLTEIWDPLAKTVRKIAKELKNDLGNAIATLDQLRDLPAVRNALSAHENEFAREFPRTAIVEIARNVLSLVRALYCEECASFAMAVPNRFSPSMMHCECHRLQYVKEKK